ncbi:GCN5-related N-acetyltransferase [uncultured Sphingomonas sp.]|uniref:GCN5-related N-acetyltransferase n=1 Tax=uncultured Sphingomonas sp. TaxID=158754 RepID=UPI0025CC2F1F|nr:GCN5-related N-acetyltransferase [uncultured Sphingomonas sp.]
MTGREVLEARWLDLTRRELPAVARERGWPVVADHCFQRILLDNAFGGQWYDHVAGRPAYAHADPAALAQAVALGEQALAGDADLAELNRRSLEWRGKAPSKPGRGTPISRPSQSKRTKIERTA